MPIHAVRDLSLVVFLACTMAGCSGSENAESLPDASSNANRDASATGGASGRGGASGTGGAVQDGSAGGVVQDGSAGGAVQDGSAGGAVQDGSAGGAVQDGSAGGASGTGGVTDAGATGGDGSIRGGAFGVGGAGGAPMGGNGGSVDAGIAAGGQKDAGPGDGPAQDGPGDGGAEASIIPDSGDDGGGPCSCPATQSCARVTVRRDASESQFPWVKWPSYADGQGMLVVTGYRSSPSLYVHKNVDSADFRSPSATYRVDLCIEAAATLQIRAFLDDDLNEPNGTVASSDYIDSCGSGSNPTTCPRCELVTLGAAGSITPVDFVLQHSCD